MDTDLRIMEINQGRLKIIATRNDAQSKWNARLYVDDGRTATLLAKRFKTENGVRIFADSCFSLFAREKAK